MTQYLISFGICLRLVVSSALAAPFNATAAVEGILARRVTSTCGGAGQATAQAGFLEAQALVRIPEALYVWLEY
jgi:hypothetical protein